MRIYCAGLPEVSIRPPNLSIEVTKSVYLVALPEGVGKKNFRYQWKKGSENVADGNSYALILKDVSEKHTGHYVCHVSNEYGDSAVSDPVFVNVTST